MIKDLIARIKRNSKVAENYVSMTFLSGAIMLINLLLYPYLIRVLGSEAYGEFVFVFSSMQLLQIFISFGFEIPAIKAVAQDRDNLRLKSRVVSGVITSELIMMLVCFLVMLPMLEFVEVMERYSRLFLILFFVNIAQIMPPVWYFQAIEKMRIITYINLSIKLLMIPAVLLFVRSPEDLELYAWIMLATIVASAVVSLVYLLRVERLRLHFVGLDYLRRTFRGAVPFFWSNAFDSIKKSSVAIFIGLGLDMRSVAIYDLANKLVLTPRMLVSSLNNALFPNVIANHAESRVRRIIRYEVIISLSIVALIAIFGYPVTLLLGGRDLIAAYPLAIILGFTILGYLLGDCYANFVFVPHGKYSFIVREKFLSMAVMLITVSISAFLFKNIFLVALSLSLTYLVEILYCRYLWKKIE